MMNYKKNCAGKTANDFKSCFNMNQLRTVGNSKKLYYCFFFSLVVQFRTKTKKDANEVLLMKNCFEKLFKNSFFSFVFENTHRFKI